MMRGAFVLLALAVTVTAQEQISCLPDAQQLCPSELLSRSPEAIAVCLKRNRAKLSLECELVLRKRGM